MELNKKKYLMVEVCSLLDDQKTEYDAKVAELNLKIKELAQENKKLAEELYVYKENDKISLETLKNAQEKAQEIIEKEKLSFDLIAKKILSFSKRWDNYFNYILEKYPNNEEIQSILQFRNKVENIFALEKGQKAFELADCMLSQCENNENLGEKFDPKEKIKEYIRGENDNGFNLEEVLNPGDLNLGDLCKELGLTEED